jgi:hypothetical protein
LLETDELVLESSGLVREALDGVAQGADFADALIAASGREAGCERSVTFDRRATKATGMVTVASYIATIEPGGGENLGQNQEEFFDRGHSHGDVNPGLGAVEAPHEDRPDRQGRPA